MSTLLIELYDSHVLENNCYQAQVMRADEVLFLMRKETPLPIALQQFLLEEVATLRKVWVERTDIEQLLSILDRYCRRFEHVVFDLFGGDALMATLLSDYAKCHGYERIALDVTNGLAYHWEAQGLMLKQIELPTLTLAQHLKLRGACLICAKQPVYQLTQAKAIKKLANYSLQHQKSWYQITHYFSLLAVDDHLQVKAPRNIRQTNGSVHHRPDALIPLLEDVGALRVDERSSQELFLSYPSKHARLLVTSKGYVLENYLYLLAKESGLFDEVYLGVEVDWNGIFPELDNVQNELDVVLRQGHRMVIVSCKMTEATPAAINELLIYANHFWGERCLKVFVCTGNISPAYMKRCSAYGILLITTADVKNFVELIQAQLRS